MAAFPAIEPIGRRYGLGAHPMATAGFSSLDEVRFLQGATLSGVPMDLEFRAISTSEATQIRNHYLGQREHRSFTLPAALWRTHSSQFNVVPAASAWRYAGQPQESPRSGGLVDVTVPLVSAFDPTAARLVNGGTFGQSPALTAGALAGYTLVSGGTFTQAPTLAPGTAGALAAPAPMLGFTGGTSLAWSLANTMYGYSFTLSSAKQIKGIGAYDANGDGLQSEIQVVVYDNPGAYVPSDGVTIRYGVPDWPGMYPNIPAGTAAPLDGVWRKIDFEDNGATLEPGTYGIFMYLSNSSTSSMTMIKNATGVTGLAGVTINGPLAYNQNNGSARSTTGDGPGYFGPVLFF
jgi:hypothetical protein